MALGGERWLRVDARSRAPPVFDQFQCLYLTRHKAYT
jgi:hypothetical protein